MDPDQLPENLESRPDPGPELETTWLESDLAGDSDRSATVTGNEQTLHVESSHTPVPAKLGNYVIERELGRGGMGVVYLGRDPRLSRRVAIKVLSRELVSHPDFRSRFELEARLLAAVNHPNVVTIHSLEEADGEVLFAIELLEGAGLDARLAQGRMSVEETLRTGAEIAAGLEAAHGQGVIHRDLKPANVKANAAGTWKVLDFGLALSIRRTPGAGVEQPRMISGTPGYMSPEQIRGEELDAATDTWALGCLLFECLSGTKAFGGATYIERAQAILARDPEWEALPENLSPALRTVLRALLDKDRSTRLASAAEVRARLESMSREIASSSSLIESAASAVPHSLPAERDEFVGRGEEMEDLAERLAEGQRLVTVLGMGGTGKTRFVTRYGWNHLSVWPGGVFLCDLSETRSLEDVVSAVAAALGTPLTKNDPVLQLGHSIAGRGKCLIILDNFEQVKEHAEATVGRWLARAADATFVVTSREILSIAGEHMMLLAPLPLEGAGVELFVLRARARHSSFALTAANEGPVREIVALLDGIPLAIELAAARMRVLSPEQLLPRLKDRFQLLIGARGPQARQATLRAAVDWSWALLAPWEQAALAQASVFVGGFTLEAAESVLDLSAWPDAPLSMDVVQSLVDKSLLRTWTPGGAARLAIEEPYFGMYLSIQEYAHEKLRTEGALADGASGAFAETMSMERHGRYFAAFGTDESIDALDMHGGVARRQALSRELDNVMVACRRAVGRRDGPTAVATYGAAWSVLAMRGPLLSAVLLGTQVLTLDTLEPIDRARAARTLAVAQLRAGRTSDVLTLLSEALAIYRVLGNRRGESIVLSHLGGLHKHQGDLESALSNYQESLAINRETGNRPAEGFALSLIGTVHRFQDRTEEARRCYNEALTILRDVGDRAHEADVLSYLGSTSLDDSRVADALRYCEEALAIYREIGNRSAEGIILGNMGIMHRAQGRKDEALRYCEEALAIHREVGNRAFEGVALGSLGDLYDLPGRADEAIQQLRDAVAIHREVGNRGSEGLFLGHLGIAEGYLGRSEDALRHYREALAIHREVGARGGEASMLINLSALYAELGDIEEAVHHCEQSLAINREIRSRRGELYALGHLGTLHRELGRMEEAVRHTEQALALAREMQNSSEEGRLLGSLGRLHAMGGRFDQAREALAAGETRLRDVDARAELGFLFCERGECERLAGDLPAAHRHLAEAEFLAQSLAVAPNSGMRREIAKLRAAMSP